MTPKEKVLKARPDAVCKKNLAGTWDVYDNDGLHANAGTARMAWAKAWNSLPVKSSPEEE